MSATAASRRRWIASFDIWYAVETASVSAEFAGFTAGAADVDDGLTVIGYQNRRTWTACSARRTSSSIPQTGEIVESDIFLNSALPVVDVAAGGEATSSTWNRSPLHEIGHLLGLGHSALGETELSTGGRRVLGAEAVMFPIAFSAGCIHGRTLQAPTTSPASRTSTPPTAARANAAASAGGHQERSRGCWARTSSPSAPRTGKLVGGLTLSEDGSFVIAGLEPGPHVLRVEPLDDGDIESFFDLTPTSTRTSGSSSTIGSSSFRAAAESVTSQSR